MVVFKKRDSVPSGDIPAFVMYCVIGESVIPTYRVYRLYDIYSIILPVLIIQYNIACTYYTVQYCLYLLYIQYMVTLTTMYIHYLLYIHGCFYSHMHIYTHTHLQGYASALRSLTSGMATFSTIYSHHHPVDKRYLGTLLKQIRGY